MKHSWETFSRLSGGKRLGGTDDVKVFPCGRKVIASPFFTAAWRKEVRVFPSKGDWMKTASGDLPASLMPTSDQTTG
jgi:hypothetical protein